MSIHVPQNFYRQTITRAVTLVGATNMYVSAHPTPAEGYITISPASATLREIIYYTAKGTDGNGTYITVTLANRGLGGTTAQTHVIGEPVRMNVGAETIQEVSDALDQIVAGGAQDASTTAKGIAKLSVAPASATAPIAVGDNDPRLLERGFGEGTDGDVTITGTVTLTADKFYKSLIVPVSTTLITNGYAVYASTSITNAGTIHNNGSAGATAVNGGAGGSGGAGGTFTAGTNGGAGGANNSNGVNGTAKTCLGSDGAKGGNSFGNITTGGTAGTATAETVLLKPLSASGNLTAGDELSVTNLNRFIASTNGFALSTSAGSGGGAAANNPGSAGGGGGGGSGGVVFLASPTITNTGVISSNGGNGGGASGANDGGGGGGSGGTIFLIYKTLTAGTITVTGGTKGVKGGGGGTEADNGVTGKIYKAKIVSTVIA